MHLLHDRSCERCWNRSGSILGSKIVPKSIQHGSRQASKLTLMFKRFPGSPKIDFCGQHGLNMPQLPPQDDPKMDQKWSPNPFRGLMGVYGASWTAIGPLRGRLSIDFGPIFGRWRADWCSILGWLLVSFEIISAFFLHALGPSGVDFGSIWDRFWFDF